MYLNFEFLMVIILSVNFLKEEKARKIENFEKEIRFQL